MPVTFRILPTHSLAYVRFSGQVDLRETFAEFDNYTRHPDFRPHQSQLIDLTEVRDYERDFSRIMELQAHQTEAFLGGKTPVHLIFVAPDDVTQSMAMAALRSWNNLHAVVPLVLPSLAQACEVLAIDPSELSAATTVVG
ncbi:hypothetical protein [Thiosulfatihalobacter marinus]|uniref:hypothetical protein n=1 Tax=Thiosulfatihalobacter marinus TaxID=2792481 RepID=UPI0018DA0364|nr:hypothetical protein [Thiosulfatihalobacter marinus]